MSTICITGGTIGIGYEAAVQLARGAKYDKIIVTSRTEAFAKEAIAKLVTDSNQPETKFDFVLLDLVLPLVQLVMRVFPMI
jgi:NAD(P)-dependent dehydrogenase (short-subunit alcohol dehydrogenase family)